MTMAIYRNNDAQLWWLRLFGMGLAVLGPAYPVYFSERAGIDRVLIRYGGWRLVRLEVLR
jgi:hypothetical protein